MAISNKHKNQTILERFTKRYIVNEEDGCWEWKGAKENNWYGNFNIKYKQIKAHKASYILFKGEVPDGMDVCHSCDHKYCVNPDHLWLGTHKENMKDAQIKGIMPTMKHPSRSAYNYGCRCPDCVFIQQSHDMNRPGRGNRIKKKLGINKT